MRLLAAVTCISNFWVLYFEVILDIILVDMSCQEKILTKITPWLLTIDIKAHKRVRGLSSCQEPSVANASMKMCIF